MNVIAIRFCQVSDNAEEDAHFLDHLGLPRAPLGEDGDNNGNFAGAVFPAGDSWIELWQEGPNMPAGVMLQVVVDDADAFAAHARNNGLVC